jgi:hypothetical protein
MGKNREQREHRQTHPFHSLRAGIFPELYWRNLNET